MTFGRRGLSAWWVAALVCFTSSCSWIEYNYRGASKFYRAAKHLDYVARFVDEYGTVTVSEPLVLENKEQFAIDYQRPVKEYIDAARSAVQGTSFRFLQEATDVQTASRSDIDVEKVAAAAAAAASGGGAAVLVAQAATSAAEGAGPQTDAAVAGGEVAQTPPAFETLLPLDRPAKAVLTSPQFRAPLEVGPMPAGISERQALLVGVNDKVTENVLKYLVNPGKGVGSNKKVYIGVLQVSVQPGWRTREGYVAEVNVRPSYARQESPGSDLWTSSLAQNVQPLILSAFPSLEAQTLDLRQSIRRQVAEATLWGQILRASGATVQAEQLEDHVRRLEGDYASRNAIPVITSYANGASFGYQIRPSFQALADPASEEEGAANVIQPATFPAVILIVADEDEVKERKDGQQWTHFEWLVSSRWIPTEKPCNWTRTDERRRILAASELDLALREHWQLYNQDGLTYRNSNVGQEIKRRYNLLFSLGQGISRYGEIPRARKEDPKPAAATITAVTPTDGWRNAPTVLAIQGENFTYKEQSVVKQVTVGGVAAEFVVAGDKTIVAVVAANAFNSTKDVGPQTVAVVTTVNVAEKSAAVAFTKTAKALDDTSNPGLSLTRDALGHVTGITLDGNANLSAKELLAAIQAVLEKEGLAENVAVKVSSSNTIEQGPKK